MLKILRDSFIEKLIKKNLFLLYYSNYVILFFNKFLLPYEEDWNFFKKFKINKEDIIVDVGAHWGESFLTFKKYYKNNSIISFEPSEISQIFLKNTLKNKKSPKDKIVNYGIASKKETKKIYYPAYKNKPLTLWCSESINDLKIRLKKYTYLNVNKIKFISSLANFDKPKISKRIGILKIDTEGSELKILKAFSKKQITSTRCIFVEYNHLNFLEINNFLKKMGFKALIFRNNKIQYINSFKLLKNKFPLKRTLNIIFLKKNEII